jgi:hypothetical protein
MAKHNSRKRRRDDGAASLKSNLDALAAKKARRERFSAAVYLTPEGGARR